MGQTLEKHSNENISLHEVAASGHTEILRELLNTDWADKINSENNDGKTALHLAVKGGHLQIVKILLENGATIDYETRYGKTALRLATKRGNVEILRTLLEKGAAVDHENRYGETALHLAAKCGNVEILRTLLEQRAAVNHANRYGETVLHSAVNSSNVVVVKILLENGAKVNRENRGGVTALHLAVKNGNTKLVEMLLENGATANQKTNDGNTLESETINNTAELVKNLLNYGATIEIKGICEDTSHYHVSTTDTEIANLTIKDDDDEKQTNYGPLMTRREIMAWIADRTIKFSTNLQESDRRMFGQTSLELAFKYGANIEIIQMLLKFGADINALTDFGSGNLHKVALLRCSCSSGGYSNANEYIFGVRYVPTKHERFSTCDGTRKEIRHVENILKLGELFLKKGANINQRNSVGETPLIISAGSGCSELANIFIKCNDLDPNLRDKNGETALIRAAEMRHLEVVKLLLKDKRVNVNLYDHRGFTALHAALYEEDIYHDLNIFGDINNFKKTRANTNEKEYLEKKHFIVTLLLSSNAQVDARDFSGRTPLDLANRYSSLTASDTIGALEKQGLFARQKCDTKPGRTLLHLFFLRNLDVFYDKKEYEPYIEALFDKAHLAHTPDHRGRTALHYLFMCNELPSSTCDNIESTIYYPWITKCLSVDYKCFDREDNYGRTPFHYASENRNITDTFWNVLAVKCCLKQNENESKDENGNTATDVRQLMNKSEANDAFSPLNIYRPDEINKTFETFGKEIFRITNSSIDINLNSAAQCDYKNRIAWKCWKENQYAYRHPITDNLCRFMEKFFQRLADKIEQRDSMFKCHPTFVGSSYEGTKINLPNEFDFDLILTEISKLCEVEVITSSDVQKKGYFHIKRKPNVFNLRGIDRLFNAEGFLLTTEISSRFQAIACDVFRDAEFWREEPLFDWCFKNEKECIYGKHTRNLCMTLELRINQPIDGQYLFETISIDIVPCVHIDGWWPDEGNSIFSEDIRREGCNFVFDQPQRMYRKVAFSQPYARISFAPAESRIIAGAPFSVKAAYMVAKHMIKDQGEQTYVLKTSLFYCLEALNIEGGERFKTASSYEEVTPEDLCFWVEKLFKCYTLFCLQDSFPCYFMPDFIINLKLARKSYYDKDVAALAFSLYLNTSLSDLNIFARIPISSEKHWFQKELMNKFSMLQCEK